MKKYILLLLVIALTPSVLAGLGDGDCDGFVQIADMSIFNQCFTGSITETCDGNTCLDTYDFDGDGFVQIYDKNIFEMVMQGIDIGTLDICPKEIIINEDGDYIVYNNLGISLNVVPEVAINKVTTENETHWFYTTSTTIFVLGDQVCESIFLKEEEIVVEEKTINITDCPVTECPTCTTTCPVCSSCSCSSSRYSEKQCIDKYDLTNETEIETIYKDKIVEKTIEVKGDTEIQYIKNTKDNLLILSVIVSAFIFGGLIGYTIWGRRIEEDEE